MQYRMEGGEVIFPPATSNGPEQRIKLDFTGPNQLKIGSDQLTRKGPAPDSKTLVLGEWEGKRDMGGHSVDVRYLFYPSARCVLLVQFKTITCRYAIDGQTLRLEQPSEPPELRTFSLENGVLRVSDADQTHTYIRY